MRLLSICFAVLAGTGFLFAGLWILAWDLIQMDRAARSLDWPTTGGTVVTSTTDQHGKETWPLVEYTYTVAGIAYRSHQISFDIFDRRGGQGRVGTIVARYPVGSAVTVYFDADDPNVAILEPGDRSPFYVPLIYAAALLGGGALTIGAIAYRVVFGFRTPRRQGAGWRWERQIALRHLVGNPARKASFQFAITATVSTLVYLIFLLVSLESPAREVAVQAFGPRPLGMPNFVFVQLLQALLYLPAPWVFWHMGALVLQSQRDGKWFDKFSMLTVGFKHPELMRSQMICIGGVCYFFTIGMAWIIYCSFLGI